MPSPWCARAALLALLAAAPAFGAPQNPILFVTQTPFGQDFTNIMSTFGTHRGTTASAPRGGDLWIRYADGSLRNLTQEAGYGTTPALQIAVRDPYPHWDGSKALFSMVVGGTTQNDSAPTYFQIYEVTGFGVGQTVEIRKLPQPADYNNVTPVYASDGRILFTSDRPRNGDRALYPQLDEYETAPTVSGLWSMQPAGSDLRILDHAPSGVFTPIVDSFGRVLFTRWDHLQRDQQADAEIEAILGGNDLPYEAVTYESEEGDAHHALAPGDEVFPEPRGLFGNPLWDDLRPTEEPHTFNHFFPWVMHQDGTGLEILNHLGRHELAGYIAPARTYLDYEGVAQRVDIFLQIAEDPTSPGTYYGIHGPEFGTRGAGQIVRITAPPGANPDSIPIEYVTHPETAGSVDFGDPAPAGHTGLFRDPFVAADGSLWASHSSSVHADAETVSNPPYPQPYTLSSRYDFAIRAVVPGGAGGHLREGSRLVAAPIVESVSYFDNDRYRIVQYSGPLWELQAVEVVVRSAPPDTSEPLPAIEQAVLADELGGAAGVDALRAWLTSENLALVVSRDVTIRADRQQDFHLEIAGSEHQTAGPGATPKEIAHMQFFEGRQLRGFRWAGRRVLARPMSDAWNPAVAGAPPGAVRLAADGSMAAFVPAGRALSWQSTAPDGTPVVRERYWLTFQPGEIRVCGNCHGLNTSDVFGGPPPTNEPQALRELVEWWQTAPEPGALGAALTSVSALASLRARRRRRG